MKKLFFFVLLLAVMSLACVSEPLITETQRNAGATAIVQPLRDNLISDAYWLMMCADPGSNVCPDRTPVP